MAYSYSAIKAFKNCQRQYYETRILKNWPFPETEAIMYGKDVHKALEDYIGENKPLGPQKLELKFLTVVFYLHYQMLKVLL